jgi:hypothetical protein
MKKENRLADKTRSPEPDDLTRQAPPQRPAQDSEGKANEKHPATRANPDRSAPHTPPHE